MLTFLIAFSKFSSNQVFLPSPKSREMLKQVPGVGAFLTLEDSTWKREEISPNVQLGLEVEELNILDHLRPAPFLKTKTLTSTETALISLLFQ